MGYTATSENTGRQLASSSDLKDFIDVALASLYGFVFQEEPARRLNAF